jgi:hypothetical protein
VEKNLQTHRSLRGEEERAKVVAGEKPFVGWKQAPGYPRRNQTADSPARLKRPPSQRHGLRLVLLRPHHPQQAPWPRALPAGDDLEDLQQVAGEHVLTAAHVHPIPFPRTAGENPSLARKAVPKQAHQKRKVAANLVGLLIGHHGAT